MAEKAFALSPMTASASLPTQDDYDAISGAFMETARGRWFLAEYARRNRNTDTSTVLEAVARIERTLAEQKHQPAKNEALDVMPAVTAILNAARASTDSAFANPGISDALAQARKSVLMIREIAWGLRESGADGRICGMLEAQANAIDTACEKISVSDLRSIILGALDRAAQKLTELAESVERPAAMAVTPTPFEKPKIVPVKVEPIRTEALKTEATVVRLEAPQSATPSPVAAVAAATSAPQPRDALSANIVGSLGASLLVSGIVPKPVATKNDPLAPIRRMSAAEKIAFFS